MYARSTSRRPPIPTGLFVWTAGASRVWLSEYLRCIALHWLSVLIQQSNKSLKAAKVHNDNNNNNNNNVIPPRVHGQEPNSEDPKEKQHCTPPRPRCGTLSGTQGRNQGWAQRFHAVTH